MMFDTCNIGVANDIVANGIVFMYHGLMSEKRLKRAVGNWVSGDRFWNREEELSLLIQYLEEGAQILLVAQRRIGKTSLMREAARRIEDRFVCLQVDFQSARSPADAIVELSAATRPHASLWEKTKGVFANILGSVADRIESLKIEDLKITLRGALTGEEWQAKGDRLFEILAASEKPAVLFLDEVPILVSRLLKGDNYRITAKRRQQADAFLSWLRANGIRHQNKVAMVVTGSIGLEPIVRQGGLSGTLGYLTPFELESWSRETAAGCLRALGNEYQVEFLTGAIEEMLEQIGVCIPHYVQMFFDHAYRTCKRQGVMKVSKELAAEVYSRSMLSARGHAELSQLEERLKMVLGSELHPLALDFLTEAAVSGRLTPEAAGALGREHLPSDQHRAEHLREILGILEHDGYLKKEGDRAYVFVSKLLKDWWRARFSFTFTPLADRKDSEHELQSD